MNVEEGSKCFIQNMWPPLEFFNAVRRHWGSLVTSGAGIGVLGIWQSTGHFVSHSVYWSVAVIGLVVAFYRTWFDEHQQVVALAGRLNGEIARQRQESGYENKRELIRVTTLLRDLQDSVLFWREIVKDKWGRAPATVSLLPKDWSTVIYQAGKISADLREEVEAVGRSLAQANSLITEFLSMQVNFRDAGLMPKAYKSLDEVAPQLSNIIVQFEAFEKSSG